MDILKKIVLIVCLFLMGCQASYSYTYLPFEEVKKSIDNQSTFYLEFSQTGCVDCKEFKSKVLNQTKFDRAFYIVDVSQESVEEIRSYFPDLSFTPTIYKIEEGKIQDSLVFEEEMDLEDWQTFTKN